MMDSDNLYELNEYSTTPDVLLQVKLQIEKDLGLTGFKYSWSDVPKDLPAMVPELDDKILQLKSSSSGDLMKIIYRVDLTEKQYRKLSSMPGEWSTNLAKAIVLREFQKVLIRRKYAD